MRRRNKKSAGSMIGILIFSVCMFVIYLSGVIYFREHFYIGTVINGNSVSGKSVSEAKEGILKTIESYSLELKKSDGTSDILREEDVGLDDGLTGKIQNIKDTQEGVSWIIGVFNKKEYEIDVEQSYDENKLKKNILKLSCMNQSNITTPRDATLRYNGKEYEITKEIQGNKVDEKILYEQIVVAILEGNRTIDLEKLGCYEKPKYNSQSKEIIDAKSTVDKYVSAQIVYEFGSDKEIVNEQLISKWINIESDLSIIINNEKVQNYISMLADKHDIKNEVREFKGQSGKSAKVTNKEHIKYIDREQEAKDLINNIKEGAHLSKKPIYKEKELVEGEEIVTTYVEIDLTKQYIWFYKEGDLIAEGNVVTGNVSSNHSTPPGIFSLNYKQRDTVLRGVGYSSPVDYWMPFNGGIGIHDASWRSEFGGDIYKQDGSHGCINTPYEVVKAIFNNIDPGTMIICHY